VELQDLRNLAIPLLFSAIGARENAAKTGNGD